MTKLGTSGFFYLFGGVTVISVIYLSIYVGETKQLTDKEKKELFVPGGKYGRKLKGKEVSQVSPMIPNTSSILYGVGDTQKGSTLTIE